MVINDIEKLQKMYRSGTRIQRDQQTDEVSGKAVTPGEKGTVLNVENDGKISVQWDNGEVSSLDPAVDSFGYLSIDDQILEAEKQKEAAIAEGRSRSRNRGNKSFREDNDKEF